MIDFRFFCSEADPMDHQTNAMNDNAAESEPSIQKLNDKTKKLSSQDYFGSLVSLNDINGIANEKR